MKALVSQSELAGRIRVPSSKSYTIRGLMCAALASGINEIISPLSSDDTEAAQDVLDKIGVTCREDGDIWRISGGNFHTPAVELFCRESATTQRFMVAICTLVPGECLLMPAPSLARRPIEPLLKALRQIGVDCAFNDKDFSTRVRGGGLHGGTIEIAGDISSQFISALLLIAPFAGKGVNIRLTTPLASKPYVMMTLECLHRFGIEVKTSADMREYTVEKQEYRPARFQVEGDWSSASYFIAAGAVNGAVEIENLNKESSQGDKVILDFLRQMGASVEADENTVKVTKSRLSALRADLTDCIDLLPTVAVLAALADGDSEFTGISRARMKESDRVAAVKEGLERMGIAVRVEEDRLTIIGSKPAGAVIDSKGDHRIAMAFSMLGLVAGGTTIEGAECVAKTFPDFWGILNSIGGEVKLDG
ncbi:3-phosphoshikimate 1-carboxyvinyltransferase [Chloroflexota bacterium]